MIPDYQSLMRPVLQQVSSGEIKVSEAVKKIAKLYNLTEEERNTLLPSGKQTVISNRVHWAKTYLKKAGLIRITKRGFFEITERGKQALLDKNTKINNKYLHQFEEFKHFQNRAGSQVHIIDAENNTEATPDEALLIAHKEMQENLAADLLEKTIEIPPHCFEALIVKLLISMGYGGFREGAGRVTGRTGDDGVDGIIDQDPLGVDPIYIQAKRYSEKNKISSSAIRDFFGALSLKQVNKGIFVTTSSFTRGARETAQKIGARIVLIDGIQLTKLMIENNIGCYTKETLKIKNIDENFFDENSMDF